MRFPVRLAASRGLTSLLVSASLLAAWPRAASAEAGTLYTISEEDGYGIADCMHEGQACGRVIADSWCESHGHAHVLAYGMTSDVTGSVGTGVAATPVVATPVAATGVAATPIAASAPPTGNEVVIRCGD